MRDVRLAAEEWARLFKRGDYFEAHEAVEADWLAAAQPERTFLKGLIHAAVTLYHLERGNLHGARVKHASCRRYLQPFLPQHAGVDLAALLADLEVRLKALYLD